jgi:hypothetical protein
VIRGLQLSCLPVADDVAVGPLAPGETIGRRDPAHRNQGHQFSCLPVADDVAVGPLTPGETVGRRDPAHRDQGLEQQGHSVVHGVGHLRLITT